MFKCQYCNKEFETKQKLGGHSIHCKKNPNYNEEKEKKQLELARESKIQDGNYIQRNKGKKKKCQYCGEEHFIYGLKNHEKHCHLNPNRISSKSLGNNFLVNGHAWNKGLTKEKDERILKYGNTYKEKYKEGKIHVWSEGETKYTNEKILNLSNKSKNTINEKAKNGDWHFSVCRLHITEYKGIKLHSSFEVAFAKWLDKHNIKWSRPCTGFSYIYNNEEHMYFPDFYLNDFDLYIETKGYSNENDIAKWIQFPHKLDIYYFEDLVKIKALKGDPNKISKSKYSVPLYLLDKHIDFEKMYR